VNLILKTHPGKIQKLNPACRTAMLRLRPIMSLKSPSSPLNYSDRFQEKDAVVDYDAKEYGAGSYSSFIWGLQRPVLEKILADFRQTHGPVRLLDFACGTGRVIASLEPLVDAAEGIDISDNMVAVARKKCRTAQLKVGDVLSQPELLQKKYDVITSFRFLLNAEPELRGRVLKKLRAVVREPDGLLVVNVHGNSRSLRHPAIAWRRWRERTQNTGAMLNELSPVVTRELLWESGFQIVRQFGFGMLPPTLYRTPLRGAAAVVDKVFAGENRWCDRSIDLLFVCRPV
jgi:ubiquinone/menaquinone biosynthesis C-methylase UbiE